ncbi:hypothetical protein NliqN6_4216 [Naganishia liquefaciens]|uniref:Histidine phosphatase family protein n=1 Tax=Naganishia liquefaciens TaxID=104408 RepID=A0A8H3TX52_9TREE|nr:hypothetical protein NliqN6_4216 [Naganishia liquefaciens]
MLENIYISRHGFRSNWVDASITTSVTGMSRDPPLAAHGIDQAQELAEFLSNPPADEELPVPELLFSSPFYRCIQTGSALAHKMGIPLRLEHGVQEWYSQVLPDTGLHPRPGHAEQLKQFFPDGTLDEQYKSTVYASRSGESVSELQARCDLFVNTFVNRIEAEFPNVKTIVIFAHAASVIALGRSLTGDKGLDVRAGCASTSLYQRKSAQSNGSSGDRNAGQTKEGSDGGVGCWDCIWSGRANYLSQGEERNWGFQDIVLNAEGHVISDKGDGRPVNPGDDQPIGLAPGMERYLKREDVYSPLKRGTAQKGQDVDRAVLSERHFAILLNPSNYDTMSDDQQHSKPASLKSRLEAFQSSASASANNNDSQRSRVPSGSLKDRIAMFNANADSAKPLIPTAAFGQAAPPPGVASSRAPGGGMIGNRLPKLDPSGASVLSRNVAQPVAGRKASENRGLYGNRIPSIVKHHTGGSTGSTGSTGALSERSDSKRDEPETSKGTIPPPQDQALTTSADLDENAVDLSSSHERQPIVRRPEEQAPSSEDDQPDEAESSRPLIPEIRAEDLVPSTLPKDDDRDVSSDVSEPPSPRSTAAQAAGTPQSMSSVPALERIASQLSLADSAGGSNLSVAGSQATYSSLRVETGAADDDSAKGGKAEGSQTEDDQRRNVSEEQDNLSDISTPTGTPKMAQREYLPEIPGSQSHPIGGLSLHPDGTVSPAAFGSGRKGSIGAGYEDQVMVDTSAIPDESQKLKHEGEVQEEYPNATETEKNRKGNEPTSKGDFQITEDHMVNIQLPEDDPALTEEGRELQRKAKEKLHAEAERKGKSEWEVMEENSDDKADQVKREQRLANAKETGNPETNVEDVHAHQREEAFAKAERNKDDEKSQQGSESEGKEISHRQEATAVSEIQSKDFGATHKPSMEDAEVTRATIPSNGDIGDEPESPLSNEDREHLSGPAEKQESQEAAAKIGAETSKSDEVREMEASASEVLEPPTSQSPDALDPESQRSLDKTLAEASGKKALQSTHEKVADEDSKREFSAQSAEIQDMEDIPTGDDAESHKQDQDPNIDSLLVGKSDAGAGVKPEVEIMEGDSDAMDAFEHGESKQLDVEPAPYVAPRDVNEKPQSPRSATSVPSEIEEPEDSPATSNSNVATATFPSVPKQEPVVTEISEKVDSSEISRAPTPGPESVNLPSVPKESVDSSESKVRVGVTLSPGKHLGTSQQDQVRGTSKEAEDENVKRFLAKKDGSDVESGRATQSQDTAPSLDAVAQTISAPGDVSGLAKSTSSSSTLSNSTTSSKKKNMQDRGRSPLLDMDMDGEDGGETGWAKVSVNKTKYS